jgi:prophage DNA circulation protein
MEFFTDTLTKKGGKKTSTHEIVDSDESITQDQGNKTDTFPLAIYFTNDEFDESLNEFESLLRERYSIDAPGILRHPLWGDITVCPTSWEPTIELVSGIGVGKITVEFIQMFPRKYPESTLNNTDIASSDLDEMSLIDSAASMAVSAASAASNVAGKVQAVVGVISSSAEFLEKVEDEMTALQNEISNMIDDVGGNILEILLKARSVPLPGPNLSIASAA